MNLQPGLLQQLPAELRQVLLGILNQGPQEVDQNAYPPVNGEVFSSRKHIKRSHEPLPPSVTTPPSTMDRSYGVS